MRRLPGELVTLMRNEGLFSILTPRAYGGLEYDLATAVDVIEAVAKADAAAGWCLLKVATTNQLSAYIDPEVAAAIWTGPHIASAGSLNPRGRAVRADGGWHVSGRWDWGTATGFSDWIVGGAMLFEQGADVPLTGPMGPQTRLFLLPSSVVQFIDTWHVHGMRGTGSQDFAVDNVFVPDRHAIDMTTLAPRQVGPLYDALPYMAMMMVPHAPVATGIALACIEAFSALSVSKTPLMSKGVLADKAMAQDALGRAVAEVEASRAYLKSAIARIGDAPGPSVATALHLAATHATHSCVSAVDRLYAAAGGTAVFEASPIQRHFRDIHVAASHFLVNAEKYAAAGRVTLGLSPSMLR
nr:acyl-CoA dehydrogenase family protein [Sphingobium algorifonticola]